jgi:hypothetical protein
MAQGSEKLDLPLGGSLYIGIKEESDVFSDENLERRAGQ